MTVERKSINRLFFVRPAANLFCSVRFPATGFGGLGGSEERNVECLTPLLSVLHTEVAVLLASADIVKIGVDVIFHPEYCDVDVLPQPTKSRNH